MSYQLAELIKEARVAVTEEIAAVAAEIERLAKYFEEDKHPRDSHGRFATHGGTDYSSPEVLEEKLGTLKTFGQFIPSHIRAGQLKSEVSKEIASKMKSSTNDMLLASPVHVHGYIHYGSGDTGLDSRRDLFVSEQSPENRGLEGMASSFQYLTIGTNGDMISPLRVNGLNIAEDAETSMLRGLSSEDARNSYNIDPSPYSSFADAELRDAGWMRSSEAIKDPAFLEELRNEAASNLIQAWARSSNDSDIQSLAIQESAESEFGVRDTHPWSLTQSTADMVQSNLEENGSVYRDFLRTQYEDTQSKLADLGYTPGDMISLLRGVDQRFGDVGEQMDARFRPLTSFTTDPGTARDFMDNEVTGGVGSMLKVDVPVSDIFSTPYTGNGCLSEKEVVVLGGVKQTEIVDYISEFVHRKDLRFHA